MTRANYIFGIWGGLNTLIFAVSYSGILDNPLSYFDKRLVCALAAASIVIPFTHAVMQVGRLQLHFDEQSSKAVRAEALAHLKTVVIRTPFATTLTVLLFVFLFVATLANGGTSFTVNLNDELTDARRLLLVAEGMFLGFVPCYFDLFVVRKCQDLLQTETNKTRKSR